LNGYDLQFNKTWNQNSPNRFICQSISTIYSPLISKSENNQEGTSFSNIIQKLLNFKTSIIQKFQGTSQQHQANIEIPIISNLTLDQIFKQFNNLFY
jgi:hypothetical protein